MICSKKIHKLLGKVQILCPCTISLIKKEYLFEIDFELQINLQSMKYQGTEILRKNLRAKKFPESEIYKNVNIAK